MKKVKIEDSKLASYILDELNERGYKIDDFDVHKTRTGRYECQFLLDMGEDTHIDVTIEERSSVSAGDSQTELHCAYNLNHGCDNFPAASKLRKGDLLQVEDAPNNNESSLKIRLLRWGGYSDYIDHEVDRNVVENFIDEILKRLGSKDFVE